MDEDKLKAIVKEVVTEAVDPTKKQLDGVVTKLDGVVTKLDGVVTKLDGVVTKLDGVVTRLDDPDTGLEAINRKLDANIGAVVELEKTVKGYADMYKINDSNIRRMEKRLEPLEEDAGRDVPPELKLEPLSEHPAQS